LSVCDFRAAERGLVLVQSLSREANKFLQDFDIDGDGTFSYDEFLLFLVLLSMPLKDMQV
jgi:Ca2+-binding EF-hand superfamily protein